MNSNPHFKWFYWQVVYDDSFAVDHLLVMKQMQQPDFGHQRLSARPARLDQEGSGRGRQRPRAPHSPTRWPSPNPRGPLFAPPRYT
ncbi:hypothetical protein BC936DRAFT_139460 [Jimgerdemannia flammicorona]|uniref:Uncharacterized protein n=2 Tax=Jimgerdemannia flammicorona TaxID=994334 RepID=A0A433B9V8_9FUNG|nr:hypothetical protein BC936DRAFT_139460 [Jimgerdemannia flammicorona]RUS24625.1 hypothetical protein BC938DRAFT_473309 [Jimgerdemannia flammicorona]